MLGVKNLHFSMGSSGPRVGIYNFYLAVLTQMGPYISEDLTHRMVLGTTPQNSDHQEFMFFSGKGDIPIYTSIAARFS